MITICKSALGLQSESGLQSQRGSRETSEDALPEMQGGEDSGVAWGPRGDGEQGPACSKEPCFGGRSDRTS